MRFLLLLVALASAAPGVAQSPAQEGRDPRPGRVEASHPAAQILEQREALRLSPEQVVAVERIHTRFQARNRALWAVVHQHERMEREEEAARRSPGARASDARRQQVRDARQAAREAESR